MIEKPNQQDWDKALGLFIDYELRGASKLSPVQLLPVKWAARWYFYKAKKKSIRWAKSLSEKSE